MSLRRLLLVCLTTFGLIALPGVASSASASASADETAAPLAKSVAKASAKDLEGQPFATRIQFWPGLDRTRVYGTDTVIQGQIMTNHGLGEGSWPGTVTLERRFQGESAWNEIRTTHTVNDSTAPRWTFTVPTIKNSTYRVRFAGDVDAESHPYHLASFGDMKVTAFRKISLSLKSNTLAVWGKVAPNYSGKRMAVERKTCASCSYTKVRSIKVTAGSKYRTTLTAPAHGKWWFRLSTPTDQKFQKTITGTIVTRRVAR